MIPSLLPIYTSAGYSRFKINKFEEYDFYAKHKEFLVSDRVLAFTDTNGKLMALKPDVTLSIIKSSGDFAEGEVSRYCYKENVYRVAKRSGSFCEIMQAGLECIGDIGEYNIAEVLSLADESLRAISEDSLLAVTNLDVLSIALESIDKSEHKAILKAIDEKNTAAVSLEAERLSLGEDEKRFLISIADPAFSASSAEETVKKARFIAPSARIAEALDVLLGAISQLDKSRVNVDLSITGDMSYYGGIHFSGYVKGVPEAVLSGGQYDRLMKKMGKKSRAIGFAVYLDLLERLDIGKKNEQFDIDVLVVYGEKTPVSTVMSEVKKAKSENKSVVAERTIPAKLTYRELYDLR